MSPSPDQNRDDIQHQRQPWQWGFALTDGGFGYRGLGFALIPRLFSPRPARGEISTEFHAAFCPRFAEIGCWPTGIPSETVRAPILKGAGLVGSPQTRIATGGMEVDVQPVSALVQERGKLFIPSRRGSYSQRDRDLLPKLVYYYPRLAQRRLSIPS
jgi:hypothetical protein